MLAKANYARPAYQRDMVAFRGINYSDQTMDGDLRDALNLSARRFPYLSTRRARVKQGGYSGCTALTARGKLVAVRGTDLLYDGEKAGTVMAGEKQFAVVNTKMVIWPDKVYLDLTSRKVKPLGAKITCNAEFTTSLLTVTGWSDEFKVGDCITISGCTLNTANNKDVVIKGITITGQTMVRDDELSDSTGEVVLKYVDCAEITVSEDALADSGGIENGITLERKVPDMDYICESENRLWGCSSKSQTIYASSLGDPTNFFVYEGLSTDSYALSVGTEGEFTGCCKLSSSVLFWKETKLHKLLGSYPAEYSLYSYDIEGLQKGCHKSLQIINETLYYMGLHGVYAYSGGMPTLMSVNFGDRVLTDAVAGSDGDSYYLSVLDGKTRRLLVYETRSGVWVHEDDTRALDFARIGKDLYFLSSSGEVWLADGRSDDLDMDWMAQFVPFYETVQGRKRYSKLLLRTELPRGAWMRVEVRFDGGPWREAGKIIGLERDSVPMRVPINRCDCFEVRLSGRGPCTVLAMLLEYQAGSDA